MYGTNLKEYAQNVLDNKQTAVFTKAESNMLTKRLQLENFTYPLVEIDLYNMVVKRYSNPRTRRCVLQTLNCLLGIKMKTGKPSHTVYDLPDFEELDSYIQTPKNKYQARSDAGASTAQYPLNFLRFQILNKIHLIQCQ